MTICSVTDSRNHAIGSTVLLFCACLLLTPLSASHAQDGADKASGMLDNLKQRSPEERWQRVKKQYPAATASQRLNTPSQLPVDHQGEDIPPSPQNAQLIPRLVALPVDTSNDWVLPARDPVELAQIESAPPAPPADASKTANPANAPAASKEVPAPTRDVPTPSTVTQEEQMKTGPTGDVIVGSSRPLRERRIADIIPQYDRDRDSDIREFAIEKGKEFGILFQPKSYADRSFPEVVLAWEATNFYYHPLYFSDPALERYGHAHNPIIQPFASIARFGVQTIFLPYQMTIDPPLKQEYPLGFYRPGDVVPKLHYQVPLNAQAAIVEAAAISGLFFIIQ